MRIPLERHNYMNASEKQNARSFKRRPLGRYRYVRLRWRILFSVIDALGASIFVTARWAAGLFSRHCDKQSADPQRILIVQLDHLGDAVISTVMLPLLRKRYPAASIDVLCGPWNRDLFQSIAAIDRVHVSRINRFIRGDNRSPLKSFLWTAAVFSQGLRLRRENFDLGIDVRGEFPNALILWLAGIKRRLGWSCGGGGFLLTNIAPFRHNRPEVKSRLALLAELGITPTDRQNAVPRFQPPTAARRDVAAILDDFVEAMPNSRRQPLVALHISAGTPAKCWPVEHYRKLVDRFRGVGANVVLVGSLADHGVSQAIIGSDHRSTDIVDLTGRLDVVQLAALLERVGVFIGPDSGPAHLAAAVQTPVVALFSGTNNHRQWCPHASNVTVIRYPTPCSPCHREQCPLSAHTCMREIRPADVFRAAVDYISIRTNQETTNNDRPASKAANTNC